MNWRDHITSDPSVCHGKTCFKGTRVMVSVILDCLAADMSIGDIVSYPPEEYHGIVVLRLTRQDAASVVDRLDRILGELECAFPHLQFKIQFEPVVLPGGGEVSGVLRIDADERTIHDLPTLTNLVALEVGEAVEILALEEALPAGGGFVGSEGVGRVLSGGGGGEEGDGEEGECAGNQGMIFAHPTGFQGAREDLIFLLEACPLCAYE